MPTKPVIVPMKTVVVVMKTVFIGDKWPLFSRLYPYKCPFGFKYSVLRKLSFVGMCRIEAVFLTKCMFLR